MRRRWLRRFGEDTVEAAQRGSNEAEEEQIELEPVRGGDARREDRTGTWRIINSVSSRKIVPQHPSFHLSRLGLEHGLN